MRAAITDEIEELGNDYGTVLREAWVKSINALYPPESRRLSVDLCKAAHCPEENGG